MWQDRRSGKGCALANSLVPRQSLIGKHAQCSRECACRARMSVTAAQERVGGYGAIFVHKAQLDFIASHNMSYDQSFGSFLSEPLI